MGWESGGPVAFHFELSFLKVVAQAGEDGFSSPIMKANYFEPVVLVGITFQDDIELPVAFDVREVDGKPLRHFRNIRIGRLERQLAQQNRVRVLIDGYYDLTEFYIVSHRPGVIRRGECPSR